MQLLGVLLLASLFSCKHIAPQPANPDNRQPEPEQPENALGLVLVGDTGTGTKDQYEVANGIETYCKVSKCDYVLMLGDNFYPSGVKSQYDTQFKRKFEDVYKNINIPFYVVLGNHDARGSWEAQVHYKSERWKMPSRYYSKRFGDVEVFGIDTNWKPFRSMLTGKRQRKWLESSLARSDAKYKIVFGHHPVYSYGSHGNDSRMKKYLRPLLKKYKVAFYVSGHDHDKQLIEKNGLRYIVSGAGAKLRKIKKGKYALYAKATLGFVHMLLKTDSIRVRFIDSSGNIEFEKNYKQLAIND